MKLTIHHCYNALVVASIVCAASSARAQEVVYGEQQPAPLVTETEPATTEEYEARMALVSIPIIVSGNKKVIDAPHANVVVGPARVALSVTF